ncbi:hypothetical protein BGZ63DRAFT_427714 [Mariannaea sp. PMI_226]|nr:hypothetical protein BGZ63DRAFT_427714 [Mariannaea sp. PMI_226]
MPSITTLPCEVVASIFRKFDNIRWLTPSLLSCRHLHSSFKESSGVQAEIIRRQIPSPLLPYSIALAEAHRLPRPLAISSVHQLLDTLYHDPENLVARLQNIHLPLALKMGCTHDAIHDFVIDFAEDALGLLFPENQAALDQFTLSPTEYLRFCRAFYRTELFFVLFGTDPPSTESGAFSGSENELLFSRHSPWENEQIACVYDFLEKRFSQASHDVLAHDVEFGELSIDYLTLGVDNQLRQLWISQGVYFVHRIVHEPSCQAKKDLLKSAFMAGRSRLPEALIELGEIDDDDSSGDGFEALESSSDDTDKGPSTTWLHAHTNSPRFEWVMFSDAAGLRERAYVFWDLDRVERSKILDRFQSIPTQPSHTYSDEDMERMEKSFDERSALWRKGGSGFWSEGDTSRVVWPQKVTE